MNPGLSLFGLCITFCSVLPALGEHDLLLLAPTGEQRDHWGMADDDGAQPCG